jgi:hypothetical protein
MNDIDASETKYWNNGKGWKAIGRFLISSFPKFKGVFNGNNYSISNLFINNIDSLDANSKYLGFFGYVDYDNANVKRIYDLKLENIDFKGKLYTGGLAGYCYNGSIENCSVTGKLAGTGWNGLLLGYNENCNINRCYAVGTLYAGKWSGGLIGQNYTGSKNYINECFIIADIIGTCYIGGFSCSLSGQITNCFSICTISVDSVAAGFAYEGLAKTNVVNSYSAVKFSSKKNVGISGFSYAPKYQLYKNINCFCDNEIDTNNPGRQVIPKSTAEMKTKETFTSATWDFDSVWAISPDLNNGYPYLKYAEKFFTPVKNEILLESGIDVWPNPATDFITINLKPSEGFEPSEGSEIQIYNTLGEKVMTVEQTFLSVQRINISELPKGMYFVKVAGEAAKFVKM